MSGTNPLASRGFSDYDYAVAVGLLLGEGLHEGVQGMAAIADVVANRMADTHTQDRFASRGTTFAAQAMAKNARGQWEFSTWSPNEANAYTNARNGLKFALSPETAPPQYRQAITTAQQALAGVFDSGEMRGISQGATYYHNPQVTAALGTGGFHSGLERQYGGTTIGQHSFTGPAHGKPELFSPQQAAPTPPPRPADLGGGSRLAQVGSANAMGPGYYGGEQQQGSGIPGVPMPPARPGDLQASNSLFSGFTGAGIRPSDMPAPLPQAAQSPFSPAPMGGDQPSPFAPMNTLTPEQRAAMTGGLTPFAPNAQSRPQPQQSGSANAMGPEFYAPPPAPSPAPQSPGPVPFQPGGQSASANSLGPSVYGDAPRQQAAEAQRQPASANSLGPDTYGQRAAAQPPPGQRSDVDFFGSFIRPAAASELDPNVRAQGAMAFAANAAPDALLGTSFRDVSSGQRGGPNDRPIGPPMPPPRPNLPSLQPQQPQQQQIIYEYIYGPQGAGYAPNAPLPPSRPASLSNLPDLNAPLPPPRPQDLSGVAATGSRPVGTLDTQPTTSSGASVHQDGGAPQTINGQTTTMPNHHAQVAGQQQLEGIAAQHGLDIGGRPGTAIGPDFVNPGLPSYQGPIGPTTPINPAPSFIPAPPPPHLGYNPMNFGPTTTFSNIIPNPWGW